MRKFKVRKVKKKSDSRAQRDQNKTEQN